MKIYISVDLEGISGIGYADQVKKKSAGYEDACQLMTSEINVAVDSAFSDGAEKIVVCDKHGGGGRVNISRLDSRVFYERPHHGYLMPSLDETFDGVILLGSHARAGTIDGFLDHTINSSSWFEYRLNDEILGEVGIEAAYAGHYNVPVIMISGDYAVSLEGKDILGNVEAAVVKWGVGRNYANCLPTFEAHQAIREAVAKAMNSVHLFVPYKPSLPAKIRLTLYRSDMADEIAVRKDVTRIDARTVELQVGSLLDICRL